jgi:hypothetical protein
MTNAVDAVTAAAKTEAFYRSSGDEWAQALTVQDTTAVKARVLEAFLQDAGGRQGPSAHASTLHFYRSGGQSWALKL